MHQDDLKEKDEFIFFFRIVLGKTAIVYGKKLNKFLIPTIALGVEPKQYIYCLHYTVYFNIRSAHDRIWTLWCSRFIFTLCVFYPRDYRKKNIFLNVLHLLIKLYLFCYCSAYLQLYGWLSISERKPEQNLRFPTTWGLLSYTIYSELWACTIVWPLRQ